MKVEQETWSVAELYRQQAAINLNPAWQRGPSWKRPRQVLLIDSILRGMDIPKIYLRTLASPGVHAFDAVDGQQRLRAIWDFRSDVFALDYLESLAPVGRSAIDKKKFSQLSPTLQRCFDSFEVSVGKITAADSDEIQNLFARLQMGVSLNAAELRNAMNGPLRHWIDAMARLHRFFSESKINSDRYKHLDYVAHAFAMAAYNGARDIKAPDLKRMVLEFGSDHSDEVMMLAGKVEEALSVLADVNANLARSVTQKWIFVDLFWLVSQRLQNSLPVDPVELAERFREFERLRLAYSRSSEKLLEADSGLGLSKHLRQQLYNYILAFKLQAGTKGNLQIRNKALAAFCY